MYKNICTVPFYLCHLQILMIFLFAFLYKSVEKTLSEHKREIHIYTKTYSLRKIPQKLSNRIHRFY